MAIKYRYATVIDGRTVDVLELDRDDRDDVGGFLCIGCGKELVAKLGEKRAKHFAHREDINCSGETYLHNLAKLTFYKTYMECVKNGTPFFLEIKGHEQCEFYKDKINLTCSTEKTEKHDITKWYKQAQIEYPHAGFIADIALIHSAGSKNIIFVEIAVTHKCDDRKIQSGIRIVEVSVKCEEDIEVLKRNELLGDGKQIELNNFRTTKKSSCGGKCPNEIVTAYVLYNSGKSILKKSTPQEALYPPAGLAKVMQKNEIIGTQEIDGQEQIRIFKQMVRRCHIDKLRIKNCLICKYHGYGRGESAIYCKLRKEGFGSNEAADCNAYNPASKIELDEIDKKNSEFQEKYERDKMVRKLTK